MPPDRDDDDDTTGNDAVARLPHRVTNAATAQREVTSVTRPLFTADESAEDSVLAGGAAISGDGDRSSDDDDDDDDTDLFDAVATVAEVQSLPAIDAATRISTVRQPLVADRNDVSDDDAAVGDGIDESEEDDDDDGDEPEGERTMVSIVVPEHLQASATSFDAPRPPEPTERSGLFDAAPSAVDDVDDVDAFGPKSTEVVRTTPRTAAPVPGWVLGLLVFGAVVVVALIVMAVVFSTR